MRIMAESAKEIAPGGTVSVSTCYGLLENSIEQGNTAEVKRCNGSTYHQKNVLI